MQLVIPGMRQRFGVAVALLGNPKLIIVDDRERQDNVVELEAAGA